MKITSFQDLHAWQEGHKLVLGVYQITKKFPSDERFALIDQMRRAAISITSNVAEAFARNSKKEKKQFYSISLGSITELQNQLLVAKDINYLEEKIAEKFLQQTLLVSKLTMGLMKSAKDHITQ